MNAYVGPLLTRELLAELLVSEGIHENAYSLYGAYKPDSFVIDRWPGGWVVFYTERGDESEVRTYDDEAAACLDLLDRVSKDEHNFFDLVAGPAPPQQADESFQQWLTDHKLRLDELATGDWKTQDSAWKRGEPDYRRYWVRITRIRAASN